MESPFTSDELTTLYNELVLGAELSVKINTEDKKKFLEIMKKEVQEIIEDRDNMLTLPID